MYEGKIQVLIVEDSAVARELLVRLLGSDPAIVVAGCASDGAQALAALEQLQPDVITMDIHMPVMDGYEATRRIMETRPVPIVIVSASHNAEDVSKAFRAMEAGAVAALEKPPGHGAPNHERLARRLVDTVKAMAEVRVIKRWAHARASAPLAWPPVARREAGQPAIQLVAIGASTGGPPVLRTILAALPKPFPVPVLIVQHISAGFVSGLAEWLTQAAGMPVCVARHGQSAQAGNAYIAPDGCHMGVTRDLRIVCTEGAAEHGLRPSVSHLFRSVAASFGARAAGVLLTGMGRDGAEELKALRTAGAVTFAQDKESAIVNGMPGAAVEIGAAIHVLPPERIAATLGALLPISPANP